ncbi:MAG: hypothetical protein DI535_13685 [Citrobacter freundii]|nr:MAG: hypothetical protein DI535_13685 [Citrobacter freundii]
MIRAFLIETFPFFSKYFDYRNEKICGICGSLRRLIKACTGPQRKEILSNSVKSEVVANTRHIRQALSNCILHPG